MPVVVPLTMTATPAMPSPDASVTIPETVLWDCADPGSRNNVPANASSILRNPERTALPCRFSFIDLDFRLAI